MESILVISKNELADTLNMVLDAREKQRAKKAEMKSFSINQVANKLGRAHATIKKYIDKGLLKTTKDGRIPESEIEKLISPEKRSIIKIKNNSHPKTKI